MSRDREWEIHNLNNVNLQGEDDVTNTHETIANFLIVTWSIIPLTPIGDNIFWILLFFILSLFLFFAPHIYMLYNEIENKSIIFFIKSVLQKLLRRTSQELHELTYLTKFFLTLTLLPTLFSTFFALNFSVYSTMLFTFIALYNKIYPIDPKILNVPINPQAAK
jgi:hypothetical protein